jgi:hypothetical protein
MARTPAFDLAAAHRYFAADCFNRAWDLMEKPGRTAAEDRLMEALSQASIFHWLQRPDVTDRNLSVGYWQAARVQSLLGRPREARRAAETCLAYSHGLEPFHRAYAHEALARVAAAEGDVAVAQHHLDEARELAAKVVKAEDREHVLADLQDITDALRKQA